jgi:hypothetical protein
LGLPHTVIRYDDNTKRPKLTAQQQTVVTQPDGTQVTVADFTKIGGGIMEIFHSSDSTTAPSAGNVEFLSLANTGVTEGGLRVLNDQHGVVVVRGDVLFHLAVAAGGHVVGFTLQNQNTPGVGDRFLVEIFPHQAQLEVRLSHLEAMPNVRSAGEGRFVEIRDEDLISRERTLGFLRFCFS